MPINEILQDIVMNIKDQQIKYGSFEIRFTFHDGRIAFYETNVHQRQNITNTTSQKKVSFAAYEDRCNGQ